MSKTAGATPDLREFSFKDWFSKFNSGLEFQTNEKIFKQTVYNVIGCVLMFSGCMATYGVFMVLNPFLKPLLWALLCGSVLYPFKVRISKKLTRCVHSLEKPSLIYVIADGISYPCFLYGEVNDFLYGFVRRNFYPVVAIVAVSCLHFAAPTFPVEFLWKTYDIIVSSLLLALRLCSHTFIVMPIVVGFIGTVMFQWDVTNKRVLSAFSIVSWFAVLCYATSFLDILQIPVFLVLLTLFISAYVYHYSHLKIAEPSTEFISTPDRVSSPGPISSSTPTAVPQDTGSPSVKKKSVTIGPSFNDENLRKTISQRRKFKSQLSFVAFKSTAPDTDEDEHIGDLYLCWVGFACAFMFFIKWWWTPYILGLHVIVFVCSKLFSAVGFHKLICDSLLFCKNIPKNVLNEEQLAVIFPPPFSSIHEIIILTKTNILKMFRESCDALSASIVMLLVIVFFLFASVFITMQIYTEGMYIVKVGSRVLNESLIFSQELNVVPEDWQNHLDSAVENAYVYGRDFISKMIKKLLDGLNDDKAAELEKMVLELYDRIYQAWIVSDNDDAVGPKVTSDAVYQIWDRFTLNISQTSDLLNMHTIVQFLNNNMTTLSSAMRNVWDFTVDNIGLILYLFETLISIILVSGSTVFSFIIDMAIFMTALFYLLTSSQDMYKPVEFITKVSPTYGNKLAVAIERSVAEVFMVSSKLSLFYGLYTWFLHNLFQMPIIYLPTFAAAIFASVPLLPTYIVCIPGVLDLWLLQDKSATALFLLLLQFAPTYFVDVAIYEDIHGGHPYLTGLAMAGGVLYFGIEGAIIGPLVLCLLLVTMNFFASLMQEHYGPSVVSDSEP